MANVKATCITKSITAKDGTRSRLYKIRLNKAKRLVRLNERVTAIVNKHRVRKEIGKRVYCPDDLSVIAEFAVNERIKPIATLSGHIQGNGVVFKATTVANILVHISSTGDIATFVCM